MWKVFGTIGNKILEIIIELFVTLVALGIVAGAWVLIKWGWRHSPIATAGGLVVLVAFLGFGIRELLRPKEKRRQGRLARWAKVSVGGVVFLAIVVLPAFSLL